MQGFLQRISVCVIRHRLCSRNPFPKGEAFSEAYRLCLSLVRKNSQEEIGRESCWSQNLPCALVYFQLQNNYTMTERRQRTTYRHLFHSFLCQTENAWKPDLCSLAPRKKSRILLSLLDYLLTDRAHVYAHNSITSKAGTVPWMTRGWLCVCCVCCMCVCVCMSCFLSAWRIYM